MFEGWDAVVLARAQFAFTMSFHIVFPAFSIGLASYLAVLEALWLWTGREVFINLFNYWLKIFAVAFGMGVVSGIVMSYQFGTNWSAFSDKTGPVIGPLMAYEVLTALFSMMGRFWRKADIKYSLARMMEEATRPKMHTCTLDCMMRLALAQLGFLDFSVGVAWQWKGA